MTSVTRIVDLVRPLQFAKVMLRDEDDPSFFFNHRWLVSSQASGQGTPRPPDEGHWGPLPRCPLRFGIGRFACRASGRNAEGRRVHSGLGAGRGGSGNGSAGLGGTSGCGGGLGSPSRVAELVDIVVSGVTDLRS
jgi:hypothetical protein